MIQRAGPHRLSGAASRRSPHPSGVRSRRSLKPSNPKPRSPKPSKMARLRAPVAVIEHKQPLPPAVYTGDHTLSDWQHLCLTTAAATVLAASQSHGSSCMQTIWLVYTLTAKPHWGFCICNSPSMVRSVSCAVCALQTVPPLDLHFGRRGSVTAENWFTPLTCSLGKCCGSR